MLKKLLVGLVLLPTLAFALITPDRIITNSVTLNTSGGEPAAPLQGEYWWDSDEETLSLKQNGATLQFGQEVQWHVKNNTGSDIDDCTLVMATGTVGASGRITIAPYNAATLTNDRYVLGVTTEDIPNGDDGKVTHFGKVRGCDLSAYDDGSVLWADPTTLGGFTQTEPDTALMGLPIAYVIYNSATTGSMAVRVHPHDEHHFIGEVTADALEYRDTYWTDLRVPLTQVKLGATLKPDFDYNEIALMFPQNDATEIAYFSTQMPHEWKYATDINPHVHWKQSEHTAVTWNLDAKVFCPDTAVPAAFTNYNSATGAFAYDGATYNSVGLHQITGLGTIDMSGLECVSAIILGKLYRNDNTTTGDVPAYQIDFHYQADGPGSNLEYVK